MHKAILLGTLPQIYVCFYFVLLGFSLDNVEARPTLVSRAIIRPIPMPGFSVSVFDDATGAPIPQVQASDGGGLIGGKVLSAPGLVWAISAAVIGVPLGLAGVKLWRVTTALGGGLTLAFAMWTALVNTISENGLAPSQSMSDMLILLITGVAFLVGMVGGAFRLMVLPAMAAICALGGSSVAVRGIILRPGLLVPPGQNRQLAFVNILIVVVGALSGGLGVIFKQRESMIFSTSCIGSFLAALAIDLLVNGQNGMSRGLRSLFDMNENHIADLVGGGYNPPLSSQIIVASSLGLALILCAIQHFAFPGPFRQPPPRDRTQSIIGSTSEKDSSSFPQSDADRIRAAPGPIWRTSVLSLFRGPGRPSGPEPSQQASSSGKTRRGSDAYNYGQGVYTLPSELLRQQSQKQSNVTNSLPKLQRPRASAIPGRSPQFTGVGLRNFQDRPPAVRNNQPYANNSSPAIRYEGAQRATPLRPTPHTTPAHFGTPRDATAQSAVNPRAANGFNTPATNYPTAPRMPRFPPPMGVQRSGAALPPSANIQAFTPRSRTEKEVSRITVDSILDAYGGVTDTGYRYGGSRAGQEGRI
ncbi:unnamed protein product [Rhizoctonia solani]|uniref:TM7S3/TM198-like domain-containing protein n=1 Tax=Rhizoctonia solani TaxID=456999 RepID=A0A8H3HXN6_9AGAM|nr:unnamed protein product [Rhizoctonia solani]